MQIKAITTEQFVEIYGLLKGVTEYIPNATIKAYTGVLPGTGKVTITSDPVHCLLFISD